jgi:hypothetical protein
MASAIDERAKDSARVARGLGRVDEGDATRRLALVSRSPAAEALAQSFGGLGLRGSVTDPSDLARLVAMTLNNAARLMEWSAIPAILHTGSLISPMG